MFSLRWWRRHRLVRRRASSLDRLLEHPRTGRVSSSATVASPAADDQEQVGFWRFRGSARAARFLVKQLPVPTPSASARSAVPLPTTTLREIRLCRGRHAGSRLGRSRIEDDEPRGREDCDAVALASRNAVASDLVRVAARNGDADADESRQHGLDRHRARPVFVTVLLTIVARAWGGCLAAYVFGTIPAPLRSQTESRITTPVALVPEK